jgi:hypothetical protein
MLDGLMALSRREFLQAGAVATIGAGFVRNSAIPSGMTQTGAPSNPPLASVKRSCSIRSVPLSTGEHP